MGQGLKRLINGVWTGTPQPQPTPPPVPTPNPLPTGGGIYTYQQTGQTSIQAASAWVASQPANPLTGQRILTFPAGTYIIPPNFGGPGGANTPCNLSTKVSHQGQGVGWTIWQVKGTFVPGTQDPLPTSGTNSLYVVKQEGGSSVFFRGIQIDAATFPIVDARPTLPGGATNPQFNKAVPYNIMRMHAVANPTVQEVKIVGGQGTSNTPPGETFSFNMWAWTGTAQFIDCEIDGFGKAAALFGANGAKMGNPIAFTRAYAHDSGHSHGFAMFQTGPITRTNCRADRNGSGTGSSGGVGFNHEGSGPAVATGDSSTGNSLDGYRYEAGPIDGGGNLTGHKLTNCVTAGSPYGLRTEKLQTSLPTMVNCQISGTKGQFEYKP